MTESHSTGFPGYPSIPSLNQDLQDTPSHPQSHASLSFHPSGPDFNSPSLYNMSGSYSQPLPPIQLTPSPAPWACPTNEPGSRPSINGHPNEVSHCLPLQQRSENWTSDPTELQQELRLLVDPMAPTTTFLTVVRHEFVSGMPKKFNLNDRFTANLHSFNRVRVIHLVFFFNNVDVAIQLGSNPEVPLSKADLSTRLFMLGSMYHLHWLPCQGTMSEETGSGGEIKDMLNQIIEHIKDGPWEVNKNLMVGMFNKFWWRMI